MRNTRRLMRLPLTVLAAAGLILASTPDVATTVAAQAQVASDASKDAQTQTTTPTSVARRWPYRYKTQGREQTSTWGLPLNPTARPTSMVTTPQVTIQAPITASSA